jgi:GR25 family glycosyltransferase involved in LPS biosynthesis
MATVAEKMANFGPVYVINLDRRTDRRSILTQEFADAQVSNYEFVSAIDAGAASFQNLTSNKGDISDAEWACTLSHLNTLRYWLNNNTSDYAIIVEDDFCLDTVQYWNSTWDEFLNSAPTDWEMIQLIVYNGIDPLSVELHERRFYDQATTAYIIKRDHAQSLVNKFFIDDSYNIPPNSVADFFLYHVGKVYSASLFVVCNDELSLVSDIHPGHKDEQADMRNRILTHYIENATIVQ